MKAAYHAQYGSADVLSIREVAKPIPKPNELLIRVHAATVNRTDCAILSAHPFIMRFFTGLLKPKRPITGTDLAGEVVAIGDKVTQFKKGNRVFAFHDMGLSSHAEYVAIPESKNVLTIPEGITFQQAAASLEAAHYAYNFINKIKLAAGQRVLINGASGGIGSALVQFAKNYGAYVIATCQPKDFEMIKNIGADKLIDYTAQDFTQDDERYDFILDAVGKSSFTQCKHLLSKNGIYISSETGPYAQNILLSITTAMKNGKKVIFPFPKSIIDSMRFTRRLIIEGKFMPLIDRQYTLEQIKEAFTYVASGQKVGNVLIVMNT